MHVRVTRGTWALHGRVHNWRVGGEGGVRVKKEASGKCGPCGEEKSDVHVTDEAQSSGLPLSNGVPLAIKAGSKGQGAL